MQQPVESQNPLPWSGFDNPPRCCARAELTRAGHPAQEDVGVAAQMMFGAVTRKPPEQMAMQGIHFHPSETPARVEEVSGRGLVFTTEEGTSIEVDQVMLATGRKPNTTNLGLEDVGVETSKGGVIKVG